MLVCVYTACVHDCGCIDVMVHMCKSENNLGFLLLLLLISQFEHGWFIVNSLASFNTTSLVRSHTGLPCSQAHVKDKQVSDVMFLLCLYLKKLTLQRCSQ